LNPPTGLLPRLAQGLREKLPVSVTRENLRFVIAAHAYAINRCRISEEFVREEQGKGGFLSDLPPGGL